MDKYKINKSAANPSVSADFDLLGEISLSDDQDTDSSTFSGFVSQSSAELETLATSKLSHEPVHSAKHLPHTEIKDQLSYSYLEAKVLELESQNCQLTGKLAELSTKETVSKSTETETRESGPPHPGSIMSLSTGSEESAVDEERFVKVKSNCEIETSSSKASSQSGKENFELEEQVSSLAHEIDSLRLEVKAKDDDYAKVKLELEALLLEKNVEAESTAQTSSQINKLKHDLNNRDTEINEIRVDLTQVIESCLEYFPEDIATDLSTNRSTELTLLQINKIAQMLKTSMESAKERDEELSNCINGYQAVSRDYETLQNEHQRLKENLNTGVQEELERFKQELLSKDEDLFEIQTQYDVTIREAEEKNKLVEQLQQKITSLESQVQAQDLTEKLLSEKLSQATEKCQQASEKLNETITALNEKSDLVTDLQSLIKSLETSVPEPSPVKSLQQHCIDRIQDSTVEHQAHQKALNSRILDLSNDKLHLESLLSSKEDEISKLNSEMERLMANIQVYQDSIEQKTSELATCANSKVEEITQIKDSQISHLAKTIESQRDEIFRMFQLQNEAVAHRDSVQNYVNQLEASLAEANAKYQSYQMSVNQEETKLHRLISELRESITFRIEHEQGTNAALMKSNEEISRMKEMHDQVEKELTRKYSASIERLKSEIRAEFERKHVEDEMLRESEQLSDRETVSEMMSHISQIRNELAVRAKEVSVLTSERLELEQEFGAKEEEIMNLQERLTAVENEIFVKNEANLKLQAELEELQVVLDQTKSVLESEVKAREEVERQHQEKIKIIQENAEKQLQFSAPQEPSVTVTSTVSNNDQVVALQTQLQTEVEERKMMERKVELLQSKISEIENSEIKSFEEGFMLKGWVRQLELENLKYQDQLNSLLGNSSDADSSPKLKTLQDEVIRLINALEERDKRCEQLTLEITRLLEERDGLQLKLSNVLKHNVALTEKINAGQDSNATNQAPTYDHEGLQSKLDQLEDSNYKMRIDLKREREARRLVQEQLLFSQTSRVYRDLNMRTRDANASSAPSSVESGSKSPSPHSQSIDQSLSDSGHMSPFSTSMDSGEHLPSTSSVQIPSDSFPSSSSVVHI